LRGLDGGERTPPGFFFLIIWALGGPNFGCLGKLGFWGIAPGRLGILGDLKGFEGLRLFGVPGKQEDWRF